MKVKVNDTVRIETGKDKGKEGKVLRVMVKTKKIVVEKVNIRTKHIKKTTQKAGEIIKFEAPIDVSNIMVLCPNCKKPTRVGYKKLKDGKKERICKKCSEDLDKNVKTKK